MLQSQQMTRPCATRTSRTGLHSVPQLTSTCPSLPARQLRMVAVRAAQADPDSELEERLAKLRKAKGATPLGQGKAAKARAEAKSISPPPSPKPAAAAAAGKPSYDYTGEQLHWEGPPHRGDLALNLALGTTLIWLPLTFAAIGRQSFVKYRFTDRRLSVQSTAPWRFEQTDVAYQEVKDIITVSRGFGAWGDMVVVLNNNDKVELRSIGNYKELKQYVLARRDALGPVAAPVVQKTGGVVTAAELMGEPEPQAVKSKKGF